MTLADYQSSFNGVTLGPGTPYRLKSRVGFRGLPTLVNKDLPKAVRDGSYAGFDVNVERILQMTVVVTSLANTAADFETNLAALEAATTPIFDPANLLPFLDKLPSRTQRRYLCRPRQHDDPLEPNYKQRFSVVTLGFQCPDPTIYDDTLNTTTSSGGALSIVNAGNWKSRPVITVVPAASPVTIVNAADGGQIVLATSTVGAIPNPVTVDCYAETVTDPTANIGRDDLVTSATSWLTLLPGTNNLTITGGSMTVAWRSAWIT